MPIRRTGPLDGGPMVLRMRFAPDGALSQLTSHGLLPGTSNYFRGNDPKEWRTGVQSYSKVRFQNVSPGIDFVFYGTQQQIEYDIVVAPGTDPGSIKLAYDGQRNMRVDNRGNLILEAEGGGQVVQQKPFVYQLVDGTKKSVAGHYVMKGQREVGFTVGNYDHRRALILDPILSYSTYLGGSGDDAGNAIAVDSAGNAYVTGSTQSPNFPTASPFQSAYHFNTDAFVTKLNPAGTAFIYSTYLGGNGLDTGFGIAADSSGNAYVTGGTTSTNFPTVSPIQTHGGIFLTKLNPTGTALLYSTYYGGTNSEQANAIAIDSAGDAYIAGQTASTDFPTKSSFQSVSGGNYDAFVAEFNPTGTATIYSTYLGGSGRDTGQGVAVDTLGNAYVTGQTFSTNFPTHSPLQATTSGDSIFVTKLSPTGNTLVYSTYFGGNAGQIGNAIAIDPSNNAYVTGTTNSGNFPLKNAFQKTFGFAYVFKLNAAGNALIYSTYLSDAGTGIAADSAGNAYVTGYTTSTTFPTKNPVQPALGGLNDAFLIVFNPTGTSLLYSSYLGGSNNDYGAGIALDTNGAAYVTGRTSSTNFPTKNPNQAAFGGGQFDGFISKTLIFPPADLSITKTASPSPVVHGTKLAYTIQVSNAGPGTANSVLIQDTIPTGTTFSSYSTTTAKCTAPAVGGTGTLSCTSSSLLMGGKITVKLVVTVNSPKGSTVTNTATVSASTKDPNLANNTAVVKTSVN
ncbi:MAG: SBBP repeat-containing protein [Acidobacteriota bacterium]|nr:SBBP repeat-containing protein [Acidobacteriota bacterium]